MDVIRFETFLLARTFDGDVLMALFDGADRKSEPRHLAAMLICRAETARVLGRALGSEIDAKQSQ